MAKNPRKSQAALSKKHLDRLHREQQQTKWITIGSIVVLVLVVGIIAFGILDQTVLRGMRAVAVVNDEKISAEQFRAYTKYYRSNLVESAQRTFQLASMFSSDPNMLQNFGSQLSNISGELETFRAGRAALDQMVADRLIRQEAKSRGITVSPEEVEIRMQEAMEYFAKGTPIPTATSAPIQTSTLSPLQLTLLPPTATPFPTPIITQTISDIPTSTVEATSFPTETPTPTETVEAPTATPRPTATPYTFEAYQEAYATLIADYSSIEIPEEIIRYVIESDIYREKVKAAVLGEVPCVQDQVWAQHILVDNEELSREIRKRLDNGEDWYQLAAEYSKDTSNKDNGGDLGWFPRGRMVKEFEDAAFSLMEPGRISPPVQTQFGWHIIRLIGQEKRGLSASDCSMLADNKFDAWVNELRQNSVVEINEFWQEIVPLLPTLPADIQSAIQSLGGLTAPTGFPTPAP
jgi:parvulin-like peptidyl-prolyl isomerase